MEMTEPTECTIAPLLDLEPHRRDWRTPFVGGIRYLVWRLVNGDRSAALFNKIIAFRLKRPLDPLRFSFYRHYA
jgi:hypothetical protein